MSEHKRDVVQKKKKKKAVMSLEVFGKGITNFDGTDFQAWKFEIKQTLIAHGLEEIVSGTRVRPAGDGENATVKAWIRDNAKAMSLIASSVEREQLQGLTSCRTAESMWNTLTGIYERKSASSKLLLLQRYHEYQMKSGDNVIQHVTNVQKLASQLRNAGHEMTEVDIMAKILGSLPAKYSMLATAWDSVQLADQTVGMLLERLIKEESRLATEDSATSALVTEKQRGARAKTNVRSGKKGDQERSTTAECFYCKKKGHFARDCRKRKRDRKFESNAMNDENSAFVITQQRTKYSRSRDAKHNNRNHSNGLVRKLLDSDISDTWITDSGASRHMTYRRDWLTDFKSVHGEVVSLGDGKQCAVSGRGTVNIEKHVDGRWQKGRIDDVLYVPHIKRNLFSVGACTGKSFRVSFNEQSVELTKEGRIHAVGYKQSNDIYRLLFKVVESEEVMAKKVNITTSSMQTWHERLDHMDTKRLRQAVNGELIHDVEIKGNTDFFCESCQYGKAHRLKFNKSKEQAKAWKAGEFIHTDLCGPFSEMSIGGARFYLLLIDEATDYRTVYFLKHKSDVFEHLKEFGNKIRNLFGHSMKVLRADNGREYVNESVMRYLKSHGIQMENTAPHTPEQNGKAERENRTVVESARTMLHAKEMPLKLWAEAVNTAVYILNRASAKSGKEKTPYESWYHKRPDLSHIRIFGSEAYAHINKQFRRKLDKKANKLILVGYQADSSNYRLWDSKTGKIIISRDVTFNECSGQNQDESSNSTTQIWPIKREENEVDKDGIEAQEDVTVNNSSENSDTDQEQAERAENERLQVNPKRQLRDRASLHPPKRYELNYVQFDIPDSFQEAVTGHDSHNWKRAIKDELDAHAKNATWTLVPRPDDRKMIDSKWIFKIIQDPSGKIIRFKARLCARGFQQQSGIDYEETFAPVARYDSLRVLLALATHRDLDMLQFDVRTSFLHGELKETIYMEAPEGLEQFKNQSNTVCKLNKSLYGLKQSSRCWNLKFISFLKTFNFVENKADKCIHRAIINGNVVYLAFFVDDGLILSDSINSIKLILDGLSKAFEISVGNASLFVGMQIVRDRTNKSMFIHQTAYLTRILKKFNMLDAKPVSIPADPHSVLTEDKTESYESCNVPYREAIGSLMFLSLVTRPDIAYAVNVASKHVNKHNNNHWQAVKRIFRYLLNTVGCGLSFESQNKGEALVGYSDADFAGDIDTRRSTTGYMFSVGNMPVTWCSQRQKLVTLSTTESEYVAAATAAKEVAWLRKLLKDLDCPVDQPTKLLVDNQSTIKLIRNPEFHKRTKHIDIKFHFIREKVENDELDVAYVCSEYQLADLLTKALPRNRFYNIKSKLYIFDMKHLNGESVKH